MWIPLIVMGIISVASGIAVVFLPETLHENLPQTIEDGDSFGRKQKFFSLAKKKVKKTEDTKIPAFSSLILHHQSHDEDSVTPATSSPHDDDLNANLR